MIAGKPLMGVIQCAVTTMVNCRRERLHSSLKRSVHQPGSCTHPTEEAHSPRLGRH